MKYGLKIAALFCLLLMASCRPGPASSADNATATDTLAPAESAPAVDSVLPEVGDTTGVDTLLLND